MPRSGAESIEVVLCQNPRLLRVPESLERRRVGKSRIKLIYTVTELLVVCSSAGGDT